VPTALSQIGQGIALPNAQASVINLVPHRAGTASSVTGFLQMIAAAAASQLVGTLQNGTAWPLVTMMGIGAVGALTVLGLTRTMAARKDF
jgi:DHA1 family bicyclomycin/chloramphenicol resistance-like MFS transporter